MALLETEAQRAWFRWFFTPQKWASYDRPHNQLIDPPDSNHIPWFGRDGVPPAHMLAVCQGYADSVHWGSALNALGVIAPSDTGNLRQQLVALSQQVAAGGLDPQQVATKLAPLLAANPALLAAIAKAVLDAEAQRLQG